MWLCTRYLSTIKQGSALLFSQINLSKHYDFNLLSFLWVKKLLYVTVRPIIRWQKNWHILKEKKMASGKVKSLLTFIYCSMHCKDVFPKSELSCLVRNISSFLSDKQKFTDDVRDLMQYWHKHKNKTKTNEQTKKNLKKKPPQRKFHSCKLIKQDIKIQMRKPNTAVSLKL